MVRICFPTDVYHDKETSHVEMTLIFSLSATLFIEFLSRSISLTGRITGYYSRRCSRKWYNAFLLQKNEETLQKIVA